MRARGPWEQALCGVREHGVARGFSAAGPRWRAGVLKAEFSVALYWERCTRVRESRDSSAPPRQAFLLLPGLFCDRGVRSQYNNTLVLLKWADRAAAVWGILRAG